MRPMKFLSPQQAHFSLSSSFHRTLMTTQLKVKHHCLPMSSQRTTPLFLLSLFSLGGVASINCGQDYIGCRYPTYEDGIDPIDKWECCGVLQPLPPTDRHDLINALFPDNKSVRPMSFLRDLSWTTFANETINVPKRVTFALLIEYTTQTSVRKYLQEDLKTCKLRFHNALSGPNGEVRCPLLDHCFSQLGAVEPQSSPLTSPHESTHLTTVSPLTSPHESIHLTSLSCS